MPRRPAEWTDIERWWCLGLARARSSARRVSHKGADTWREPFPLHAASCLSPRRNESLSLALRRNVNHPPSAAASPHLPARPTDGPPATRPFARPPARLLPWILRSAPLRPCRDTSPLFPPRTHRNHPSHPRIPQERQDRRCRSLIPEHDPHRRGHRASPLSLRIFSA